MRFPVTFLPSGATAWVEAGATVLEASRAAGVPVRASCGGRGVCGECGVRITEGQPRPPGTEESSWLARAPRDVRLACRAQVAGALTVRPLIAVATTSTGAVILEGSRLVVGVDLGTTSVSALVVDRGSGAEVGRSTVPNTQSVYGADVLSRLSAALDGHADQLRRSAWESVVDAVRLASGDHLASIEGVVIAGNTAMGALLAGADVSTLATAPFSAPVIEALNVDGAIESLFAPDVSLTLVPSVAGFVGGDMLAGIVALDLARRGHSEMLVDVGTNAEVALVHDGRLFVASAPAGPAFEGTGISCGGPAVPGAVSGMTIEGTEVRLVTIGDGDPLWFSGSGLVAALTALRGSGHLRADGMLVEAGPLSDRFDHDADGVARLDLSSTSTPLVITQLDVRALQLAKAAVRVAIDFILEAAGVTAGDVGALYVAGAFGSAWSPDAPVSLGLVPREAAAALRFAGNTSLQGASALALDPRALDGAGALALGACHVDLAGDPRFNGALIAALGLEADAS